MSSVGETLRRERVKRNLGLEQISHELKISQRFLEAIEDEDFEKLPGRIFAKSFVRQYARLLGLDEEELSAEVQRIVDPPPVFGQASGAEPKPAHVEIPIPRMEPMPRMEAWQSVGENRFSWSSPLPALALVVVVMLICSGLYAWWQRQRLPLAARAETPAIIQSPAPATVTPPAPASPAGNPPAAQPETGTPTTQAAQPVSPETKPATSPVPPVAAPLVTPPSATPPPPEQNPATVAPPLMAASGPVRVEISADETVWVLAQGDGKYLFSGTLEANQTRTAEAAGRVLLRVGNAGGVHITLNGKPIGAIGPKGQVRTVQFTSGGFQIVAGPKPSLPLDDDIL